MVRVRSKFRCLGVHKRWDQRHHVELAPVMASEKHPENKVWCQYTPSGEIKIETGPECMFEVGDYYFVDVRRLEPDEWEKLGVYERKLHYTLDWVQDLGDNIEVSLTSGYASKQVSERAYVSDDGIRKGEFKMMITNEAAWPAFVGHVGSKWHVGYVFACKDDGE